MTNYLIRHYVFGYFTEFIPIEFGDVPVNKNIQYVLAILIGFFRSLSVNYPMNKIGHCVLANSLS